MDNYRQVGREYSGKLFKGPMVDAFNRLTQSSIPTKSEQILSAVERRGGFGSSTDRFLQMSEIEPIPGPGQYKSSTANQSPSLSKKGYGGLISKSPRFKRYQYNTPVPGPGAYTQKGTPTSAISSVFQKPKSKTIARPEPDLPAPGTYEVPDASHVYISSPFKSTTKRYKEYNSVSPSPWQYNLDGFFNSDLKPSPAFRMPVKARRYPINLYDPHAPVPVDISPGPADYQHSVLPPINQKFTAPFAKGDADRFGIPVKIKRTKDLTPGPGAYYYDSSQDRLPVTGAVFMSESNREIIKSPLKQPGPAFYKPTPVPKKKSFHLNANKVWV
ncbi:hypothetical protein SteCoe_26123 [Stentor coeruleus]|uniref:Uncharacterized protein n=1 Tax=Stentor coeruleus TaxID=5963 RepID=A0A1R2BDQ7_9CILI|nr:hypothetical protein SteCoe_26123 [Stentor coeruleus]